MIERFAVEDGAGLRCRRRSPAAVGWEKDLYRVPGEADEWKAQEVETKFFAPLDAAAAPIMKAMCDAGELPRTNRDRSIWMSFVMSFLHRTPEHLSATLEKLHELYADLLPEAEARYTELKGPDDPPTFAEWSERRASHAVERSMFRAVMDQIGNPRSGDYLLNMRWDVVDLGGADHSLMVGDNPVVLVPLQQPEGHIAFPVGPKRLFVASEHSRLIDGLKSTPARRMVRLANRLTVERATRFVIAADRKQESFVRKHFGTCRIGSLATGLRQPDRPAGSKIYP